jgi:hypothetical protein
MSTSRLGDAMQLFRRASQTGSPTLPDPAFTFERDEASVQLDVDSRSYQILLTRTIRNLSSTPIHRVRHEFYVKRFPDASPTDNFEHYLSNPLRWTDLNFQAWDDTGELEVTLEEDSSSAKAYWVHFRDARSGVIRPVDVAGSYSDARTYFRQFSVPISRWGPFLDRIVRNPTETSRVRLSFPRDLAVEVEWLDLTTSAAGPVAKGRLTPLSSSPYLSFFWSIDHPVVGHTYRLRWTDPEELLRAVR